MAIDATLQNFWTIAGRLLLRAERRFGDFFWLARRLTALDVDDIIYDQKLSREENYGFIKATVFEWVEG